MDLKLRDKRALVTGGSRGIGRAIVLGLARQGVSVAACYHQESEAVASLATELEQLNTNSFVIQTDVSDAQSVTHMMQEVRDRLGGLDILVNNAGVVSHATLADLELDEWQRILDTNLTGMYLVTRAALDVIADGGSIINITSAVAAVGMVGRTHYTASKAGVIGFTRSLCKEIGSRSIRVNGIAPGIIETDQTAGLTPERRKQYENLAALKRFGQPDDIAGAALFLASDLASFVSGITLVVDGGI
jgi:3-oxoacyl-[acyl-carrier protein] reductase